MSHLCESKRSCESCSQYLLNSKLNDTSTDSTWVSMFDRSSEGDRENRDAHTYHYYDFLKPCSWCPKGITVKKKGVLLALSEDMSITLLLSFIKYCLKASEMELAPALRVRSYFYPMSSMMYRKLASRLVTYAASILSLHEHEIYSLDIDYAGQDIADFMHLLARKDAKTDLPTTAYCMFFPFSCSTPQSYDDVLENGFSFGHVYSYMPQICKSMSFTTWDGKQATHPSRCNFSLFEMEPYIGGERCPNLRTFTEAVQSYPKDKDKKHIPFIFPFNMHDDISYSTYNGRERGKLVEMDLHLLEERLKDISIEEKYIVAHSMLREVYDVLYGRTNIILEEIQYPCNSPIGSAHSLYVYMAVLKMFNFTTDRDISLYCDYNKLYFVYEDSRLEDRVWLRVPSFIRSCLDDLAIEIDCDVGGLSLIKTGKNPVPRVEDVQVFCLETSYHNEADIFFGTNHDMKSSLKERTRSEIYIRSEKNGRVLSVHSGVVSAIKYDISFLRTFCRAAQEKQSNRVKIWGKVLSETSPRYLYQLLRAVTLYWMYFSAYLRSEPSGEFSWFCSDFGL